MSAGAAPATKDEQDQAAQDNQKLQDGADSLAKAQKAGKVSLPTLVGYRGFVAPVQQNTRILANPDPKDNPVIQLPDQNSPTGKRDTMRKNDVFIEFIGGSFVTNDPRAIKWCEDHPAICRDVADPMTSTWYMMKLGQTALASRPASLPPEVDIDAALGGDLTKLGGEAAAVAQTRAFTEQANEREAVEA